MSDGAKTTHPTRTALIDTVIHLLESKNPEDVKLEEVLSHSGVSSGSLYHHFGSLVDLINHAMVVRYSLDIDESISALSDIVLNSTDDEAMTVRLLASSVRTQSPDRHKQRLVRVQTMVRAATNENFRAALAPEQQRLTSAISDLWKILQEKGLFDQSLDPMAGSLFVQAYNMGLIINDVSGDPVNQSAYEDFVSHMFVATFFAK